MGIWLTITTKFVWNCFASCSHTFLYMFMTILYLSHLYMSYTRDAWVVELCLKMIFERTRTCMNVYRLHTFNFVHSQGHLWRLLNRLTPLVETLFSGGLHWLTAMSSTLHVGLVMRHPAALLFPLFSSETSLCWSLRLCRFSSSASQCVSQCLSWLGLTFDTR